MNACVNNVTDEEHMRMQEEINTLRDENDDLKLKLEKSEIHQNDAIVSKMKHMPESHHENSKLNGDTSMLKKKTDDKNSNYRLVKSRKKSYEKKIKDFSTN